MVNRTCDFCHHSYRKHPHLGYYSVTTFLRKDLGLSEESMRDFICSDHFDAKCFDQQGRLVSRAVPTFFPQRSSKDHDQSYSGFSNTLGDSLVDDEGGRVDNMVVLSII